ncbi:MAG: hypothetical protein U9Q17_01920, partial [Chloroflexota bacterium]|nr:hypothetical protein [Chloroflexota bacterium]
LPLPAPGNDKGPKIEGATLDTERIAFDVGRDMGGGDIRWAWNLRYLNQEKRFDDPNDTLGMYSQRHNRYNTDRFSAGIEASTLLGGNHLVELFADHSREELDIRGDVVRTLGGQSSYTRDTTALTLSDSIYLLPDQSLTVVPLLRWNNVDGTSELSWSLATILA